MKKILLLLLTLITLNVSAQELPDWKPKLKKVFKFSTFYGAINGGTSLSDVDIYSVTNGLETTTIETPFDYSVTFGVRKIARMGYEPKEAFKTGMETSFSDASTIGKVKGFEFLFEVDYKRQQGKNYIDQNHFLRYVSDKYILKGEYLEDGFADIKYFETSQRYRWKKDKKLSFNLGAVQRLSEPYGYDPLTEWQLSNNNLHYTFLAIEEGYSVEFDGQGGEEYFDPSGNSVATSTEVWEVVVIPTVLSDYTERKRNELKQTIQHSFVVGFDYYHYTKTYWLHSWGNLMPYHYNDGNEFSYHKYNNGKQWYDYSGGLIFGYKYNKHLGVFVEGKYNKYWNREWHDFSLGINYVIF
mgnify:FL=1|tara:strand:+ start:1054 stop:2118 length:1065 start_codon:yes stop_codon:yes gene_type:complete